MSQPAPRFPAGRVAAFAFGCAVAGAAAMITYFNASDFRLWWSGKNPSFGGWWWIPGAWTLAALLFLPTVPPLCRELWAWLTYRPDPPLTWAEWFATFYRGHAWPYSAIGFCCLIPGVVLTVFGSIAPWWNWHQAQSWTPTACTITRSEVRGWGAGSGRQATGGYRLDIAFAYERGGRTYTGEVYAPWRLGRTDWILQSSRLDGPGGLAEVQARLATGSRHTCFVSPREPWRAYLSRDRDSYATYVSCIGPFLCLLGLTVLCARRP